MQSALDAVVGPTEVQPDHLGGRIAIVTGGARGIGYETARALASAQCKVIIVNKNEGSSKEAISKIRQEVPDADVDFKVCNLGNLGQVKTVFSSLRESLERLDFVVLSAGINANQYALDDDGIESVFGINYLGHYYALNQLWPLLRKTSLKPGVPAPRIVCITSELHKAAPSGIKFQSLEEINDSSMGPAALYGRSKVALLLLLKYGLLERVIKPTSDSIMVLSVHPGAVNTDMQKQWKDAYPGLTGKLISWAMQSISRDAKQGSYGAIWALTTPESDTKLENGGYYVDPATTGSLSTQASDPTLGGNLWELSAKIVRDKVGTDALMDWKA
ncbi:hypothetical protein CDD81_3832 [Ophiocordyceps australis]|uniref:Ketoreductase (KR) domain-containing protein n=1 Tax=Ophiocordyceps australis TaxID=1399860 RepID=A0A2C5XRJ5_9HYPO|nr:hypothetical protein CDD81_3832 [Ophiocordyceps australis]